MLRVVFQFYGRDEMQRPEREVWLSSPPRVGEDVTFDDDNGDDHKVSGVTWDLSEHPDPAVGGAPTTVYVRLDGAS